MVRQTAPLFRPGAWLAAAALLIGLAVPPAAGAQAPAPPDARLPVATLPASQMDRLALIDQSTLGRPARSAVSDSIARWKALVPLPPGRHLIVNLPAYRIDLFDGESRLGSWRAIVGKPRTPTPEFTGEATGVILNPSWNVPASIVAESVGRLVARRPAEAARRGYVKEGGRYRQKPGPNNQLGQMKLDFVNPYSIGVHDTPSRSLFSKTERALSHGCIRVDDPIGFAAALLGEQANMTSLKNYVDSSRDTWRIPLPAPVPVLVSYMTAEVGDDGVLIVYPDIYRRDRKTALATLAESECAD